MPDPLDLLAKSTDVMVLAILQGKFEAADGDDAEVVAAVWSGALAAVCRFLFEKADESAQAADLAELTSDSAEAFLVALAAKVG